MKSKRNVIGRKRGAVCALAVSMVVTLLSPAMYVKAEMVEKQIGIITGDLVRVRSGPGTNYSTLGNLSTGAVVDVLGQDDSSGSVWYKIYQAEKNLTGYMYGQYVDCRVITYDNSGDDFEAQLEKEGFPESYRAYLRDLHELYPNWVFTANHTGLYWDDVVEEESNPEWNFANSMIEGDSISSWKSTQDGAYNWVTGKWNTGFDSGNWVLASEDLVAYALDPRNFLGKNSVFMFLDQSFDGNIQTVDGVRAIAAGSFLAGDAVEADGSTFDYASVIYEAGQKAGISPYLLTAMIRQEIGSKGTSNSISGTQSTFPGYYNYYNIGAYATSTYTAIERGLWYASRTNASYGRPWNTRRKAIMGGASFYAGSYIGVGQNTVYYKKFNVSPEGGVYSRYHHEYMTNVLGAYSEGVSLARAYSESTRALPLVFEIPVYKNMPSSACAEPVKDGSPNNKLKSISVDGYSLSPSFNMDTNKYSLTVGSNTSDIRVAAAAYDSKAVISGTGNISLDFGLNEIRVDVEAENGDVRTYTLNVTREGSKPAPRPEIVANIAYRVSDSNIMSGIEPGTEVKEMMDNLGLASGASALVQSAAGNVKTEADLAATGDSVVIKKYDGSIYAEMQAVVYGDVTGDGKVNIADLIKVRNHILGDDQLQGARYLAADVNHDGEVTFTDLIKIRNHILEIASIQQN